MKFSFRKLLSVATSTLLVGDVFGQECATTTLQSDVPTNANLSLASYSYCGGTLNVSAYIAVSIALLKIFENLA
jgi:glucoamylase